MLELRTLGTLDLRSPDGLALDSLLAQPKRTALLLALVLARPHGLQQRDTLLALFWPERDTERARTALRQALYFLRTELGDSLLVARGGSEIGVKQDAIWCDAVELDRACAQGRWEDAVNLYAGDLLPGFHVTDAPEFEAWLARERDRLRALAGDAAGRAFEQRDARGDLAGAIEWARKATALAPTDETAIRRLMSALTRNGDRAAALRAYDSFCDLLAREYELTPSAETQSLAESIRQSNGTFDTSARAIHWPETPSSSTTGDVEVGAAAVNSSNTRASYRLAIALGVAALVLVLAAGYVARFRSLRAMSDGVDGSPAPGVAILPFTISATAPASWREDLVVMLAADIDGTAGLRTIDGRTVLARLRDAANRPNDAQDADVALDVARRSGARYAVQGNVVATGSAVRLLAKVFDVASSKALDPLQRDGVVDSLPALVDRLALDVLRTVLEREGRRADLSRVDLARATTQSVPALRSYLEGERLRWRSDYVAAARAYERAFALDTSFVLALVPFVHPNSFMGQQTAEHVVDPLARVAPARTRLPRRSALMVESALAFQANRDRRGLEVLQQATREFPDDAEIWYTLGEVAVHLGGNLLLDREEALRAFAAAVALDSSFHPAYHHLIEKTMAYHADKAKAARLVRAYLATGAAREPGSVAPLAYALGFGDESERRRAYAVLDTLPVVFVAEASAYLRHPQLVDTRERVGEIIARQTDPGAARYVARVYAARGQFSRIISQKIFPSDCPALITYLAHAIGKVALPPATEQTLKPAGARSSPCPGTASFFAGAYAADHGQWSDYDTAVAYLEREADLRRVQGDSVNARQFASWVLALQGHRLARSERAAEAIPLLQQAQASIVQGSNEVVRWWIAQYLLQTRRPREARSYFASFWHTGFALDIPANYYLAVIDQELGNTSEARAEYAVFARAWRAADAALQPLVRQAGGR